MCVWGRMGCKELAGWKKLWRVKRKLPKLAYYFELIKLTKLVKNGNSVDCVKREAIVRGQTLIMQGSLTHWGS